MDLLKIDIGDIGELASQVAIRGAIRVMDGMGDELFEYIVGIAVLVYELAPDM